MVLLGISADLKFTLFHLKLSFSFESRAQRGFQMKRTASNEKRVNLQISTNAPTKPCYYYYYRYITENNILQEISTGCAASVGGGI